MPKFPSKNRRAVSISDETVLACRTRYEAGTATQGQLCRDYGISIAHMGRILRYETRQEVRPATSEIDLSLSAQRLTSAIAEEAAAETRMNQEIAAARDESSGASVERMLDELAEGGEAEQAALRRLKEMGAA